MSEIKMSVATKKAQKLCPNKYKIAIMKNSYCFCKKFLQVFLCVNSFRHKVKKTCTLQNKSLCLANPNQI